MFLVWVLLISKIAYAQWSWTTAVAFTDSSADNRNATIQWIETAGKSFVFWERSTDSTATAIYGQIILPLGLPQVPFIVLSQAGVHFRNPEVFDNNDNYPSPSDTLFYLFFETDQNGSSDIYYMKYMSNGTFTAPIPFAAGPYEDKHPFIYNCNFCNQTGITWESHHSIYYAKRDMLNHSFLTPVLIDSLDAHNPVLHYDVIAWERIINDTSKIYSSAWNYNNLQWSAPALLYGFGENTELSFYKSNIEGGGSSELCWQNRQNATWGLTGFTYDSFNNWLQAYDIHSTVNNKTSPSGMILMLIIKKSTWGNIGLATFASDSTNNEEIFASDWYVSSVYHNLSNSIAIDRHPQLFYAGLLYGSMNRIIDIWESYRNGHWTLVSSNFDFVNQVEDYPGNSFDVKLNVSPNPFIDEVSFNIYIKDPSTINCSVYDVVGHKIIDLENQLQVPGNSKLTWNGKDESGYEVTPGVYFCRIYAADKVFCRKVLKLRAP